MKSNKQIVKAISSRILGNSEEKKNNAIRDHLGFPVHWSTRKQIQNTGIWPLVALTDTDVIPPEDLRPGIILDCCHPQHKNVPELGYFIH